MNFFILKEYINYIWNAKTAHGVHSPFVYKMVSKCLRNTDVFIQTRFYSEAIPRKYLRLLNRIVSFYDLKKITTNFHHDFEALISQNFNDSKEILEKLKENQFWFILNIRKNKEVLNQWEKVSKSEEVQVSIDLFQIGIIIKKETQVKEHFQLKPKF